jgi:archaellum component FlaG (FlaF/FlaG flagellin family)
MVIAALIIAACRYSVENKNNEVAKSSVKPSAQNDTNKIYKNIHLIAKPASISIDTAGTAVIVVDMENDSGSKSGMFDRAGIDISMIQQVVSPTAKVVAALISSSFSPGALSIQGFSNSDLPGQ